MFSYRSLTLFYHPHRRNQKKSLCRNLRQFIKNFETRVSRISRQLSSYRSVIYNFSSSKAIRAISAESEIVISKKSRMCDFISVTSTSNFLQQSPEKSVALKLEIERVALLYRQNVPGGIALMLYALSYAWICGDLMGTKILAIWLSVVGISGIMRMIASWQWLKFQNRVQSITDLKPWHFFIQAMLFISGALWGVAGWMMQYSNSAEQQIFASLTVIFMVAGGLVCWSISPRAMFLVVIPSFTPWIAGLLLSPSPVFILMGALSSVYLLLGIKVGLALGRYVESALKLNIENAELNESLQEEIRVKDQTEQALRIALSSSNAMEWIWDIEQDCITCKGDLSRSLGLQTRFMSATMAEFLQILHSDDRLSFLVKVQSLALGGGGLDTEVRVRWSDGKLRDLVFRGSTQTAKDGRIASITGIAWDTTAQKAQGRIRLERDIHEAANKAKSMFLANASHEIRTPLAAISGYVEALLQKLDEKKVVEPQTRSDLLAIDRNSKHLISLVNDFLDLSKLETGRLYIQKSPMSLEEEVAESVLMVKSTLDAKKLELNVIHETALPQSIECDALRLRQILVNLLTNAIKFTDSGRITIRIAHETDISGAGTLTVRIADSGIGMDQVTQSNLFEPFMRGTAKEVQRVSGSGLGLALSRHLARLLGGDLKLISSTLGAGSAFELTVHTGNATGMTIPKRNHKFQEKDQLIGANLLVVDDDADLRDLMQRFLVRQGAQVDVAENGATAVERALTHRYDVILMDMKMPIINGYEATAALRRRGYDGPVIALTAYANSDDKQRSLEAGCDNYLSKPVDFGFMVSTIRSYLDKGNERLTSPSVIH